MWLWRLFISVLPLSLWMLGSSSVPSAGFSPAPDEAAVPQGGARMFAAKGVVLELKPDEKIVVIRHEAVTNFMAAMTMPFKVKDPGEMAGLRHGDEITFQLHVANTESWVDHIAKIGTDSGAATERPAASQPSSVQTARPSHPLRDYDFTNELGQPVSLNDFRGQALAITFIYTRCPLPDYCPRLSKNFQEASQKLLARSGAPTNWHFLSFSFDPEFDTPPMLKAYANSYQYDPKHWSFLTGPADKIGELARGSGVSYEPDGGTFNHNFRTLIVDAAGHLQMIFPTSGDLSDQIVAEMLKAAGATNAAGEK